MNRCANIFEIRGLAGLSARYRIADVLGLDREQNDFYRSADRLVGLSRKLRKPVSFLEVGGDPVIVYPDGTPIDATLDVGTRVLTLRPRPQTVDIDFTKSSEFDEVRLRIVRYAIEAHLRGHASLWQPSAGQAFFEREPSDAQRDVGRYDGTRLRPIVLQDGTIGLCVDKSARIISLRPLPKMLTREQFNDQWKGTRCIYRYGDTWYEIRCEMLARQSVSDYPVRDEGRLTNLLRYVVDHANKPVPKYVANLDPAGSVIVYRNQRGEERAVPSELCFPIRDTDDIRRTGLGRGTIVAPNERLHWARNFVRKHLQSVPIGDQSLVVTDKLLDNLPTRRFSIPDLSFGHDVTLSVNSTPGAKNVGFSELGRTRLRLLEDAKAGLLEGRSLDAQYLVIPASAAASFGPAYIEDLVRAVRALHPQGNYRPVIVQYDDARKRTFVEQAKAIKEALINIGLAGFAVVMIHRCKTSPRAGDGLAAFVMQHFRTEVDVIASVVHYDTAERLYESTNDGNGRRYRIRGDSQARAAGYFRNVALSKVLLTNQVWPFGLAQPLRADLIIGIDVKNNACGLLAVADRGRRIASSVQTSRQKEQLDANQICSYLCKIVRQEAPTPKGEIRSVVIHRDGRAWPSEIKGARKAIDILRSEGVLAADASLTVVEIHKKSSIPLRIFAGDGRQGGVGMATIGDTLFVGEDEAFVCTTGLPFTRPGTPNPLQIRRVHGPMSIADCAHDIFDLSNLAWTRPEDCSRLPVTLRLVDRFLADEASEYDGDALAFVEELPQEESA